MKFFPIISRRTNYVGVSRIYSYRKYKDEISEDCAFRCVYCDCHCNSFGGHAAMELDHFRPKSERYFPELEDDPANLLLACRSCNGKKRDDWPMDKLGGLTHFEGVGYIDPFESERTLYFHVENCGSFSAKEDPAAYMIEQLALNRPFAVAVRARRILRGKLHAAIDSLAEELRSMEGSSPQAGQLGRIADLLQEANRALRKLELEDCPAL
ncbi:HNH endonuclease [Luteolibacter arcticus]|uniref:HNH endonuclease n=1 Tax=Luteolibacter arcticus TaxID=1581411 RepID=A0ABT3GQQ2_9BACT|nr:HNH endonuclease signature motif containing protein [Luteolibacter arcticus]MCW1925809.1 HNH endonuclease [Luteolibacter arcticus]